MHATRLLLQITIWTVMVDNIAYLNQCQLLIHRKDKNESRVKLVLRSHLWDKENVAL
jgi:hypothetical protein